MGTGKGTFLLLAREKKNGKLSVNPIFLSFSRERILPYLAALRSNICDIYVVLVRVHSQLVTISHSVHMIYVFSIFHILQSAYAYDLVNIFIISFLEVNKYYLYTEIN